MPLLKEHSAGILAEVASLLEQKDLLESREAQIKLQVVINGLQMFRDASGINLDPSQFKDLKKCQSEAKKEFNNELQNLSDSKEAVMADVRAKLADLKEFMTEDEPNVFSADFPTVGKVVYKPKLPFVCETDPSEGLRDQMIEAAIDNGAYDCLRIDEEKYILLNQTILQQQLEDGVDPDKLHSLPGIYDKLLVDKDEVKLIRSRRQRKGL